MLLNKTDINLVYPKFGNNIPDREIAPYISDAEIFDLQPILPDNMYANIEEQLPVPQIGWDRSTSFVVGSVIFYNGRFWKSKTVNQDSEPTGGNTVNWGSAELLNLWLTYLKPFTTYKALARFYVEHGYNITQYGVRVNREDTSDEISDKGRGAVVNNFDSKANHYGTLISRQFGNTLTYDGVTYNFDSCGSSVIKPKFKIFQAGESKNTDEWHFR
jgi:hypothetical protein